MLPVVFDFQRVFADEVGGEFFNRGPRAFGLALKGGLAPADDAGVGGHFDQAHPPVRIELFDFGDFHGGSPVGCVSRFVAYCGKWTNEVSHRSAMPRPAIRTGGQAR